MGFPSAVQNKAHESALGASVPKVHKAGGAGRRYSLSESREMMTPGPVRFYGLHPSHSVPSKCDRIARHPLVIMGIV